MAVGEVVVVRGSAQILKEPDQMIFWSSGAGQASPNRWAGGVGVGSPCVRQMGTKEVEAKGEVMDTFTQVAVKEMEAVVKLSVPVIAECKVGDNWGEMKPFTVLRRA